MIAALTGQLVRVAEPHVYVQVGPILYELLVPAADFETHRSAAGGDGEITLHTLLYLEGDPNRGNLEPRLLGFLRADDKRFFELFTEVKGIGPRKALKALTSTVGEIANAIESRDVRFLSKLDGIGTRTAVLMVAYLAGTSQRYVAPGTTPSSREAARPASRHSQAEEDAIALVVAGGERRAEAEQLLARAKSRQPDLKTTEALWKEMLRQRGG
jgi:Holliday junction DNA helicase RuvA